MVSAYIHKMFGRTRVMTFRQEVDKTVKMLMRHPDAGIMDPLFADRPVAYRSVIVGGLSKMVYRIDEDNIHIVAFWDCRQDPEKQAAKVK